MTSIPDEPIAAEVLSPVDAPIVEKPLPVWSVFAVFVGTAVGAMLAQIPVVLALVLIQVAGGSTTKEALESLGTPLGFIAVALPAQLAILGGWWLASTYGDPRARGFRAIGSATLPWIAYACFAWASLAVLYLGVPLGELAEQLFGHWDAAGLGNMYEAVTWANGIVLVLFIALVPGFVEELFFRGYMQRRLLARYSPWLAVPLVAIIFAGFHGTPVWAMTVLPLGFWLGILAWRTGSLWPGIVCHAFVNGSVNLYRVGVKLEVLPDESSDLSNGLLLGSTFVALVISLVILVRYRGAVPIPAPTPAPVPDVTPS